jgi:hypothetical protein
MEFSCHAEDCLKAYSLRGVYPFARSEEITFTKIELRPLQRLKLQRRYVGTGAHLTGPKAFVRRPKASLYQRLDRQPPLQLGVFVLKQAA